MARVTVEDCLSKVKNRFHLVLLASKRARHLATGSGEPMVERGTDKETVLALREIAADKINDEKMDELLEQEAHKELIYAVEHEHAYTHSRQDEMI